MSFNKDQIAALDAPLHSKHVKQRAQAGRQLSYLEGWHCIAEANRIFGFDGWDRELASLKQLGDPREIDGKYRVAYMATVRIRVFANGKPIFRDGTGYGSGIDRDLGQAHESAIKEAETDAMKRALMTFGNPFGLALYDKEQANVTDGVADALITELTATATRADLDATKASPAFRQAFATLSESDKGRVIRAGTDHRATLPVPELAA